MATNSLSKLSRKHGVKVGAGSLCSVEEVTLAVGEDTALLSPPQI